MIIFHFRWFTKGEIPSLFVLHQSSGRAIPAAPGGRGEAVGQEWKGSGLFWEDAHLERCKDHWQLSDWAALGPARPLLALHCLLLLHIPVAGMTCCGAGSQTSHQWCSRLSRPRANSLLKQLSYFSFSWGCGPQATQQLTVDLSCTIC